MNASLSLICTQNGWSPLHSAAKSGFLETVRFLVECGANPILECNDGKTAIQYAAGDNHQDVVSFLLKRSHNTLKLTEDRKVIMTLILKFWGNEKMLNAPISPNLLLGSVLRPF